MLTSVIPGCFQKILVLSSLIGRVEALKQCVLSCGLGGQ